MLPCTCVLVVSESQSRELNQHRTKTIENEAEVERLKRQLISERFERFCSLFRVCCYYVHTQLSNIQMNCYLIALFILLIFSNSLFAVNKF